MRQVVIVSAVRTPIGSFGGSLRPLKASDLGTLVVKEAIKRAGLGEVKPDEVILGCTMPRSDEPNVARLAVLGAGLPPEVPAFTVHRVCNSGMQAIFSGCHEIMVGEADVVVAGGTESMSNADYVLHDVRWGQRMRHGVLTDSMWDALQGGGRFLPMGLTAEKLAEKYNISREEQDELAYLSQLRAGAAIREGKFKEEILPVEVPREKGQPFIFDTDEHPRANVTLEALAKLPPAFQPGGTVTAGNSSGINDGAAALVLMAEDKAKELGIKPLARVVARAVVGVDPDYMGYGPVPATRKILANTGLKLEDIQLIECNEAFAAQYLACEKSLGWSREIVNVNGSGIALGHPVGCTGARIVVTLIYEMKRRGLKTGLATLCGGGGMGTAILLENRE